MDEDLIALGVVLFTFLAFPFLTVLAITGSIAYSRTKTWDKTRNQQSVSIESESGLLDDESDFYDTDDEAEYTKRKAEEEADKYLTFNQKFRKEFRKVWSGKGKEEVAKQKEREERRKLAKAVAREIARIERKKARKAAKEELPPYKKA